MQLTGAPFKRSFSVVIINIIILVHRQNIEKWRNISRIHWRSARTGPINRQAMK